MKKELNKKKWDIENWSTPTIKRFITNYEDSFLSKEEKVRLKRLREILKERLYGI